MREDLREILDSKITIHDKNRFEIKLDMDLESGRKNKYRVETYFFIPRALNINPNTYSKNDFYNSTQKYIRFKTPQMSLRKLIDPSVDISPLNRIKSRFQLILSGTKDRETVDAVYSEVKLLGCIVRAAVRDYIRYLIEEFKFHNAKDEKHKAQLSLLEENSINLIRDIRVLISRIRVLRTDMSNPIVPIRLRECFNFLDEFLSLTIEEYLAVFLEALHKKGEILKEFRAVEESAIDIITAQSAYRASMGYSSVIVRGGKNEAIVYRRSVLKKFISSALYLQIEISEWEGLMQFVFGLAAGVAMLFATLVMIYAQNRYTVNSASFVIVVVASYIFKDRIKDWLKIFFSKGMTRWISDRKVNIRDPQTGKIIGVFKEAFSFIANNAVPSDVLLRRNIDNITSIDEEGKPECVFKYEKEVELSAGRIFSAHERRTDINDIMRFSVEDFLSQADDPEVDHLYLNPETKKIEVVRCSRVYHINMIIRYILCDSSRRQQVSHGRVRIVLNRDGIARLEEVSVG